MITNATLVTNRGCPYAGLDEVQVARADVAALGKLTVWGSSVVSFVLRLHDGRLVAVRACAQTKEDERWLRRVAKAVHSRHPTGHAEGWRISWAEVAL